MYTLNQAFGRVVLVTHGACGRTELQNIFGGMPTMNMKKRNHEAIVRKLIMLGAALTLLLGLPFAFANRAFADPTPKFAYVANSNVNNISAYTVDSATGALRAVAGSPFTTGQGPTVTVDPSGRFAYVASYYDNNVSAYTINGSTGALREIAGSPFAAGSLPISVTVDPLGRFAYVVNTCRSASHCRFGNVSAYTINSSTGALRAVAGSPFPAGSAPLSVTVDSSGQFAYVVNYCDSSCARGTVSAYTINSSTGVLTAVAGSPFAAGNGPRSVTVDPSGQFAYVANSEANTVSAYTINSSTGALSAVAGSPFAAGGFPLSATVDASGRFAYVANDGDTVSAYTINSSTGALSAVSGSPFAAGTFPDSVAVDPSGRFVYVANECNSSADCSAGTVSAYTIDSSTGALSAVDGSPFAAGSGPYSVAIARQTQTTPSVLTLTPRSLAFGNLPIHTSSGAQSVTVTNTSSKTVAITSIALRGTNPGQFSFISDCGKSLAAYRTCTIEAKFRPTTVGAKTAFLDANGGGGGLRSVKLTGTGT
jgi:6-phosphogluconolactonase (cycloisomerase 2 family)